MLPLLRQGGRSRGLPISWGLGCRWSRELIYGWVRVRRVAGYRELPPDYHRPARPDRALTKPAERSHAAIPVAIVVVGIGLYFGSYSLIVPALLGLLLLVSGTSFLSSRLNPLSVHFYLTRKPSWTAIGVVFLGGLLLLAEAYELWVHGGATRLLPHL